MLYALGPDGLVDYQKKAYGTDNEHVIPETIYYWMVENGGRHNTLRTYETTIRSFFLHNRAELRKDRNLRLKPTRFSKVTMFSIEEVKAIYSVVSPLVRAVMMSMIMGGMGFEEIRYWSETGYDSLRHQLRARMS